MRPSLELDFRLITIAKNSHIPANVLRLPLCPIGHFRVPPGLCFKTRVDAQPLIWKSFFILMQIKLIFIRKVVHLASFWKWGFLELGRGLLFSLDLIQDTTVTLLNGLNNFLSVSGKENWKHALTVPMIRHWRSSDCLKKNYCSRCVL